MDAAKREQLLKLIENPPRGSDLDRAKRHGVDLRALVENLSLTPTERLIKHDVARKKLDERVQRRLLKSKRKREAKATGITPSDERQEIQ
jgi:hypothetical protein